MTVLLLTWFGLYLIAPVVFVASWFIDLWAKSYDIPRAQVLAKVIMSVLLGLAAAGYSRVVVVMLDGIGDPAAVFVTLLAVAPPAFVLVWTVHDVNWRAVYVGGAVGSMAGWVVAPASFPAAGFATTVVLGILGCWLYNEVPRVRFARYQKALGQACSCCGYQQRAVHELFALGPAGEAVVDAYLNVKDAWRAGRVQDEVQMCRLTSA